MGHNKRTGILAILLLVLLNSSSVPQSSAGKQVKVEPGVGFDGLEVGKTTIEQVISRYGTDYELILHEEYSQEYEYRRLGLSFYVCKQDPLRQVFVIEIVAPFSAKTSTGVALGKTKFSDVLKKHGEPIDEFDNGLEYEGIHFYYDLSLEPVELTEKEFRKRKVVGFDITEKSGLRQCDDLSREGDEGEGVPADGLHAYLRTHWNN